MRQKCINWPNNKHCCTNTCRDCKCNYRCKYCREKLWYDYPILTPFRYRIKHSDTCYRWITYKGRFCDDTCMELKMQEYKDNPKVVKVLVLEEL